MISTSVQALDKKVQAGRIPYRNIANSNANLTVVTTVECTFITLNCPSGNKFDTAIVMSNRTSNVYHGSEVGKQLFFSSPFPIKYNISEYSVDSLPREPLQPPPGLVMRNISTGLILPKNIPDTSPFFPELVCCTHVAVDPDNGYMYYYTASDAIYHDERIYALDTITNTVHYFDFFIKDPQGIAFNPYHDEIDVLSAQDNAVYRINTVTEQRVGTISLADEGNDQPYDITFNPNNGIMYIQHQHPGLYMINAKTNTLVGSMHFPSKQSAFTFDPNKKDVMFISFPSPRPPFQPGTIVVMNTTTFSPIGNPILVGADPGNMVFANNYLIELDNGGAYFYVIDTKTNTIVTSREVTADRGEAVFDPINGYIHSPYNCLINQRGPYDLECGSINTLDINAALQYGSWWVIHALELPPLSVGNGVIDNVSFNSRTNHVYVTISNCQENPSGDHCTGTNIIIIAPLKIVYSSGCSNVINAGQSAICEIRNIFG